MKKLIYTLLLCLPLLAFYQYNDVQELDVTIDWNGRHCAGSIGICTITTDGTNKATGNTRMIFNETNTITFIIDTQGLSETEKAKIVGNNNNTVSEGLYYTLDYDFELEKTITDEIEKETCIISQGTYPITIKGNIISITFNLK